MPATVSKSIPRLFFVFHFFLLVRPVHVDNIVNTSLLPDTPTTTRFHLILFLIIQKLQQEHENKNKTKNKTENKTKNDRKKGTM